MKATDPMRCQFYSCTMRAFHCVQRQTHNRSYLNHRTEFSYVPLHLTHCASGKCAQGVQVKKALKGQEIPDVTVRRGANVAVGKRLDGGKIRDRKRWANTHGRSA